MASWVQASLQGPLNGVRARAADDASTRQRRVYETDVLPPASMLTTGHHQPLCCELKKEIKIGKDWDFPGVQWLGFHLSIEGELV